MTTTKDLWGQISDLEAMVREWKARTIEVEKRWLAAEARAEKAETILLEIAETNKITGISDIVRGTEQGR